MFFELDERLTEPFDQLTIGCLGSYSNRETGSRICEKNMAVLHVRGVKELYPSSIETSGAIYRVLEWPYQNQSWRFVQGGAKVESAIHNVGIPGVIVR